MQEVVKKPVRNRAAERIESHVISVPILPHLKRWLINHYQLVEPVHCVEDSPIGLIVWKNILDRRTRTWDRSLVNYTDRLRLLLTKEQMQRSHRMSQLIHINDSIHDLFTHDLYSWIRAGHECAIPASEMCKRWLNFYDIEEHWSYAAAYKSWQRFQISDLKKRKIYG